MFRPLALAWLVALCAPASAASMSLPGLHVEVPDHYETDLPDEQQRLRYGEQLLRRTPNILLTSASDGQGSYILIFEWSVPAPTRGGHTVQEQLEYASQQERAYQTLWGKLTSDEVELRNNGVEQCLTIDTTMSFISSRLRVEMPSDNLVVYRLVRCTGPDEVCKPILESARFDAFPALPLSHVVQPGARPRD